MLDILMVVHTMGTMDPSDNDRFSYIANMLISRGAKVEMVTSDFEHHKKRYRNCSEIKGKYSFDITFLHEKKYKKNVSLARILGHISFGEKLKKYLSKRKKPDVIYCAMPPTFSADIVAKYAKKNGIRFIVDVQDLWPESFTIALGNSVVSRIIMLPLKRIVNDAYKKSDVVIAVSDTYVKRALLNMNSKPYYSIYLGTDGNSVERALMEESETIKSEDEFAIGYIGNIGASYDFLHVFEALSLLKKKGYNNIKFHIFGDGNYRNQVEEYIKKYFSNVYIYGYLPYIEMIKLCRQCDMVLNPIIAGTASSVINKVGDYAAMGIAVVNTQDNMEYRELVEKYNAGFNSVPENSESIAECIEKLYLDKKLCSEMGTNNRKMFNDLFDRSKTYKIIVDCIERN